MTEQAGRELDALVAEKVMGWAFFKTKVGSAIFFMAPELTSQPYLMEECARTDERGDLDNAPRYSTDIAHAWQVAEKLRLTVTPGYIDGELAWSAARCNWSQSGEITAVGTTNYNGWTLAETAPLVICLAALKAIGIEVMR